ncbi:MAG: T9SS type A sorting domain-containing protein [Flavobacteriales bacterium]|nr:T9SS type A sorting domain-containing protein [Flavobacteriales bacterium]
MIKRVLQYLSHTLLILLFSNLAHAQVGEWTWKGGSTSANQTGVYGTKGVPDTSNHPGARLDHVMWTGGDGNVWAFGGSGYGTSGLGLLNDLWKFDVDTEEWTWMKGSNNPGGTAVYGTQGQPDSLNTPGATYRTTAWTDSAGSLWMFGGSNGSAHNEMWKYDIQSNMWTYVDGGAASWGTQGVSDTTNRIPGRMKTLAWTDTNGLFWFFGGLISGRMHDLWKYEPGSNVWTWMKGSQTANATPVYGTMGTEDSLNVPRGRWFSANWQTEDGYLWLGLGDGSPGGLQNDIWKYNIGTNNWTWVNGGTGGGAGTYDTLGAASASNRPRSREALVFWTDKAGKFWLFGGISSGGSRSDLWKYDPDTDQWTWHSGPSTGNSAGSFGTLNVSHPNNNPATRYYSYSAPDGEGNFWMLGGNTPWGRYNDLWKMTLCAHSFALSVDTNITCNGGANGAVSALIQEGTGPISYLWNTGDTTSSINGLTAGVYRVTVSDFYGCGGVAFDTVHEPAILVPSINVDSNVTCNGGNNGGITAGASGGTAAYSFEWNNAATTAILVGQTAGSYTVTITDANGCTTTTGASISQPTALISIAATDSNITCFGDSNGGASAFGLGGTSPYSYLWSTGSTSGSILSVGAGQYTVTVTDAQGCEILDTVEVTQPTALALQVNATAPTCAYDSLGYALAQVNGGTSPYDYAWSNGSTSFTTFNLGEGTVSILITDDNGCTIMDSVTLVAQSHLISGIDTIVNVLCFGDSTGFLSAWADSGALPYTYAWSNGDSLTHTTVLAGNHFVVVTDSVGCSVQTSATVTEPDSLEIHLTVLDEVCLGDENGTIDSDVDGGVTPYAYLWNNGSVTSDIEDLDPATYTLTVEDANGCITILSGKVNAGNPLPVPLLGADTILTGASSLLLNPGTFFQYEWQNGSFDPTYTATATGLYSVTVQDEDGCEGTDEINIEFWPMGLSELEETAINIYPNPTNGILTIETDVATYAIVLEDMKGAIVQRFSVSQSNKHVITLDAAPGMYILWVQMENETVSRQKVVVE